MALALLLAGLRAPGGAAAEAGRATGRLGRPLVGLMRMPASRSSPPASPEGPNRERNSAPPRPLVSSKPSPRPRSPTYSPCRVEGGRLGRPETRVGKGVPRCDTEALAEAPLLTSAVFALRVRSTIWRFFFTRWVWCLWA